ncbi:MAG: hypothetical protein HOP29_05980 [Phycisphaerales bacterium]|nr:hypothetical protein [Phycisphaerales bacterium]
MGRRAWVRAAVMACAWMAVPVLGQTGERGGDAVLEEMKRLRERMEALEARHEADQTRIGELESRLQRLETPAGGEERAAELETLRAAIRDELGAAPTSTGAFSLSPSGGGAGNAFNPAITAFIDTGASISSDGGNNALNRFNLREVELDLRAAISPSADGALVIALGEEIEQQRNGEVEINREVDLEEGFIDFHTLPYDMSLKLGKFRGSFGRNNLLHTHDLPQVTRPRVVTAFLGPEGLATTGVSWSWHVPNPWDKYLELTGEVVNADGGAESPILGGPNADNPAVLGHVRYFDDVGETSTMELGGTYLFGRTDRDSDFNANVFGVDATYQWTHSDPSKFKSFLVQGEAFWADNDVRRGLFGGERHNSFGAYALAQYQLEKEWYVGLRADYTEFPNSESRGEDDWDFALAPYLTWYITEFLRARLEFQHRVFELDGDGAEEQAVFLQFTGVMGAHPAHPYWVNR